MHSHALTEEQIECLRGCSQYPQYYKGRRAFEEGQCPFCRIDRIINNVIYEAYEWIGWEVPPNFTTRASTLSLQFVFFPQRHVRSPWELNLEERLGYFRVIDWAKVHYDLPGGGIINRFGDMRYNVGTIMHMHATIMVPNRTGGVIVPLAKSAYRRRKDTKRMKDFARRYEAGEVPASM